MHFGYNPSDGTWCVYNNSGYLICSWKESDSKMTKERELLQRALEELENQDAIIRQEFETTKGWVMPEIIEEIRSYLATEEGLQEMSAMTGDEC